MPAKRLVALMLFIPALLYAEQEDDAELFEFLAMFDQSDNVFIDAEMDDKYVTAKVTTEENLTNQKVTKSGSDE